QDVYQNKQARPSGAFQKDMEDIVKYIKENFGLPDYNYKNEKNTGKNQNKNFVLIIDEINRGNVSQIFGELITLIEESKRIGNEEELKVTLPYSKKEFGVPSNLYIIGTMNTADRSIEALDTALRRRFSFVEMMPDLKVVEEKQFSDFPRVEVMQKINQRIELLLDKNYTLGHSYFLKDNFRSSFKNEIIPLLQEYFYNDCGKIGLILGKGFVREKEISKANQHNVFADFDTRNEIEIIKSYELIPFEDIEFNSAIESLLV
ncbi:MAG: AAA family ATPase, partial [Chryseobacterium gambrini]|nr:AAA family ATPase [Chryseobacterium gambrini]